MPTICNILIALNILQVTLLVACKINLFSKQKIQEVECEKINDEKDEIVIERYKKMLIKLPELFSRNITDLLA